MANALATRNEESIFSNGEKWALAAKMATSLAQSTIVPKDYQGNANNTLVALEIASRLGTSPLMVMQNLNIIYGRPAWSSQYIIGMINGSGKYDMELQYDEKTDKNGKPFSCQCWTEKNGRKVTGPIITMDMARAEGWTEKNGSKWKTMPQIMLRYRAASFFGRMNCPELAMGFYSREEVVDIGPENYKEVTPQRPVEEEVRADIAANANTVDFEEAPAPVEKPATKQSRKKKEEPKPEPIPEPTPVPMPEPEETVIDIGDEDDGPEWG